MFVVANGIPSTPVAVNGAVAASKHFRLHFNPLVLLHGTCQKERRVDFVLSQLLWFVRPHQQNEERSG
jgi:hypothetical protein